MNEDYVKVPFPYCYVWMTRGYHKRKDLLADYMNGYLKRYEPDLEFVEFQDEKVAICKKK